MTKLRSIPTILSEDEAKTMIIEKDFYDSSWNKTGAGLPDDYAVVVGDDEVAEAIIDRSTGLMWQQSGSLRPMLSKKDAPKYIAYLNMEKFAGYDDWRLPTLEEAMSLMKPVPRKDGSETTEFTGAVRKHSVKDPATGYIYDYVNPYISMLFDDIQHAIYTADKFTNYIFWTVNYNIGTAFRSGFGIGFVVFTSYYSVRAVRSAQSS